MPDKNTTSTPAFVTVEDEVQHLHGEVDRLQEENSNLRFELSQMKKMMFGPRSERSCRYEKDEHTGSLFEDTVQTDPTPEAPPKPAAKNKKKSGRRPVPMHLEERDLVIEAPEQMKVDAQGNRLQLLGYEVSHRLGYQKAKLFRVNIKREKWGHGDSREVLHTADPLKAIVAKGKLMDELIHHTVFQKYFMAVPLYRQLQDYNALGADLSKSTLCDAVKAFALVYEGVWQAIRADVFGGHYVHMDDTPIRCQGLKKGKMRLTYFFAVRSQDACYFAHSLRRNTEAARKLFDFSTGPPPRSSPVYDPERGEWAGHVMMDALNINIGGLKDSGRKGMACWAHVRRKFYDLREGPPEAKWLLEQINALYRIERDLKKQMREEGWDAQQFYAQRTQVRQSESKPIVEAIEKKVVELSQANLYPPGSGMGKALQYAANRFVRKPEEGKQSRLEHFLADGSLPFDNNPAEQSIRPATVGRKNYLFVGSEDAGHWAAVCYSIMESCRLVNMDPRDYLQQVTPRLLNGEDPQNLTPLAMKELVRPIPRNF